MFKIFSLFTTTVLLAVLSSLASARIVLPNTINCASINDNIGLIQQLEESGSFREPVKLPQAIEFDFNSNAPYTEYLKYARDKVLFENPKGQLPCPIQTPTSQLLYPDMDLDLQLVADMVAPFELPVADSRTGVLLIHGLTDSPYLFHDLAVEFYAQGITVRTLMLPGHGTAPAALLDVEESQWRQATEYALTQMLADFDQVYVGGFSTGAALLLDQLSHGDWSPEQLAKVKGMFMWAPASKAKSGFAWAAKYVDWIPFVDYINTSADIDFAKYESFPFNAAAQVNSLMNRINGEDLSLQRIPDVPIFVVASEVDQTIDTQATIEIVEKWHGVKERESKANDTLIYYGQVASLPKTIQSMEIYVPECINGQPCSKVLNISHNAAPNSPMNPHYGVQGNYKYCEHHFGSEAYDACKTMAVTPIGEITPENLLQHSIVRRLTYNPFYDQMAEQIAAFIKRTRS